MKPLLVIGVVLSMVVGAIIFQQTRPHCEWARTAEGREIVGTCALAYADSYPADHEPPAPIGPPLCSQLDLAAEYGAYREAIDPRKNQIQYCACPESEGTDCATEEKWRGAQWPVENKCGILRRSLRIDTINARCWIASEMPNWGQPSPSATPFRRALRT